MFNYFRVFGINILKVSRLAYAIHSIFNVPFFCSASKKPLSSRSFKNDARSSTTLSLKSVSCISWRKSLSSSSLRNASLRVSIKNVPFLFNLIKKYEISPSIKEKRLEPVQFVQTDWWIYTRTIIWSLISKLIKLRLRLLMDS